MISEDEAWEKALEDHPEYADLSPDTDEIKGVNPHLHLAMHALVERQLTSGDLPAVKETMDWLVSKGMDRHEAIHRIGNIVSGQIFEMLKEKKLFDEKKYISDLAKLKKGMV